MIAAGGRSDRRNDDDGKPRAPASHSATKSEEDTEVVEVSSSSDVETDSDWEETDGSSEGDSGEETSGEGFAVEDEKGEDDDVVSMSERVSRLLIQEKKSVGGANLKLVECKAYLRKHGLRVGGTKAVCLERINEHLRIKDGNAEQIYPVSSFIINCTGDVCKGDIVLFTQKVYESFDLMTKHGRVLGRRTIAGRVIKESYGSAKQQHTFTVEVFWSKGLKQLPPLFPLLVKGRNLYKMRTFRQVWEKEEERKKVLDEKHKRGSEARRIRAIRISKLDPAERGRKSAKASKPRKQPQMNKAAEPEQRKPFLQHPPRPCANGTSRSEASRNFQCLGNNHPNVPSYAQNDHLQGYHGQKSGISSQPRMQPQELPVNGTGMSETSRNFQCRENSHPNLQSYTRDDHPQGYHGQRSTDTSQPRMQPQMNNAAEAERRRHFLEHPRPFANGTSGNFQRREDINPNLQPYAHNGYPQLYHDMQNFQGTTSVPMPGPHNQQYYGGHPPVPPPSYSHPFRHTNEVRYGSYNPRNTSAPMPRPHNTQYNGGPPPSYTQSFRHPNDGSYGSFNPRNTRYIPEPINYPKRYPREAYEHMSQRPYGQYEHENGADRRGY